jgi:hypothetical protein
LILNTVTGKWQPFTLNFVTLTVSCSRNIGINEGYKNLLRPFLRRLQKKGKFSYMWKAEFQKRGQLHYHLTTNEFQPWTLLRNEWNNLQRKHGYLNEYARKHRHYDANSTDVHAVYKVNDLAAYLSKYMSKPMLEVEPEFYGKPPKIEKGKIWDCSVDLKQKQFSFIPTGVQQIVLSRLVKEKKIKHIVLDNCEIFKLKDPTKLLTSNQLLDYNKWLTM